MGLSDDLNSIQRLAGDTVEQFGKLVQHEANLARAELAQKIKQAGIGVGYIAAAGILCVPVLMMLLLAFALWLTQMGLSPVTAHLAAAGAGAICCGIFALIGFRALAPEHLRPKATLQQLKRDVETVKGFAK